MPLLPLVALCHRGWENNIIVTYIWYTVTLVACGVKISVNVKMSASTNTIFLKRIAIKESQVLMNQSNKKRWMTRNIQTTQALWNCWIHCWLLQKSLNIWNMLKSTKYWAFFNSLHLTASHVMVNINSLWLSLVTPYDDRSGSTLAQVIDCCLMAPSHYLTQCWVIIS